ncbi:MAG: hypothetical protein J5950_01935 [Clostridia bacterium]|nr:hypothetical protein [Clostridia bacterium]
MKMKYLFKALTFILIICVAAAFSACKDKNAAPGQTPEAEQPTEELIEEIDPKYTDFVVRGKTVEISTREELYAFAAHMNEIDYDYDFHGFTIKLMNDIDLDPSLEGGKTWTPLYVGRMLSNAVFDGQGHTINGVTVTPDDLEAEGYEGNVYGTGFFGLVDVSFTVKNVKFTNEVMEAHSKHCGGVIGSVEYGADTVELDHVTVSGLTLNGGTGSENNLDGISIRVGGLVGASIQDSTVNIHDCVVENSSITGFHNVSGLIGCINEGYYTIRDNKIKNVHLNYSASYAENVNYKNPEYSRYFADPFYCVNSFWGEYHTDYDVGNGNIFEGLDSYDVRNEIHYSGEEGKSADCTPNSDGYFPAVGNSPIRPRSERGY